MPRRLPRYGELQKCAISMAGGGGRLSAPTYRYGAPILHAPHVSKMKMEKATVVKLVQTPGEFNTTKLNLKPVTISLRSSIRVLIMMWLSFWRRMVKIRLHFETLHKIFTNLYLPEEKVIKALIEFLKSILQIYFITRITTSAFNPQGFRKIIGFIVRFKLQSSHRVVHIWSCILVP